MSSKDQTQQTSNAGLVQSTPLVTISGPGSISRGIAVPAGDNHPLAATTLATPPVNNAPATNPQMQAPTGAPPSDTALQFGRTPVGQQPLTQPSTVAPTTVARPLVQSSPAPLQARVVPANVSPSKSLDSLADLFLSERSFRTDVLGLAPMLRPLPLPREDGLPRLRTLVERRAWGDVLKISTTMLNSSKDAHADVYSSLVTLPLNALHVDASTVPPQVRQETVEIMMLQCHAWLKLRRYVDLTTEVERWNFLKHIDATAESPEWLPWSIHILAGQIQQYSEDADQTSDTLFAIRDRIAESKQKDEAKWLACVDSALSNLFLRQGKWRLAVGSLDRIMELVEKATQAEVKSQFSTASNTAELETILTVAYKCEILSRQGRILLEIGALSQTGQIFEKARNLWSEVESRVPADLAAGHPVVGIVPALMDVNEGLFLFSKSNFERSLESFSQAMEKLRARGSLEPKYRSEDWMASAVAGSASPSILYSECINNMALCHLYACRIKDAIFLMENLVRENPTAFLTERVAFNLCTLYELGSDSAASARKKRVLQLIAKRFFLHDVGPESFRVT